MNELIEWAIRNGVSKEALTDLTRILDYIPNQTEGGEDSEGRVQQRVELHASKQGARLWRNNVGACMDEHGNFIRYGLCNRSKQQNKVLKSSDLIGITPVVVTQDMVGSMVGVFTAVETKRANWVPKQDDHTVAQARFINLVKSLGGIGGFENGSGMFYPGMK